MVGTLQRRAHSSSLQLHCLIWATVLTAPPPASFRVMYMYCTCCCSAVQTVQSLLPPQSSSSSEGGSLDKLKEAALQWGQQQGMSVRSAAAFARSCRL